MSSYICTCGCGLGDGVSDGPSGWCSLPSFVHARTTFHLPTHMRTYLDAVDERLAVQLRVGEEREGQVRLLLRRQQVLRLRAGVLCACSVEWSSMSVWVPKIPTITLATCKPRASRSAPVRAVVRDVARAQDGPLAERPLAQLQRQGLVAGRLLVWMIDWS